MPQNIGKKSMIVAEKFSAAGFESARLEAEVLLSAVLGKPREFLLAHPENKLSFCQNWRLDRLVEKRLKGWPTAYLIGHKEFYGFDFVVDKNVLIPRPETELMVDEVLRTINKYQLTNINLIDVGTGSGCIIVSLAKILQEKSLAANFYALDVSRKALAVARKNAQRNGLTSCINFVYSDLLDHIDKKVFEQPVIITANLPYLNPNQVKNSPTIQKEPKIALLAGVDGLDLYRCLFRQIKEKREVIKNKLLILCEIDEAQTAAFSELAEKSLTGSIISVKKDLNGYDRFVVITIN